MTGTGRIRVDLTTASRDQLVAEVERLADVADRWASQFNDAVKANADGFQQRTAAAEKRLEILRIVADQAANRDDTNTDNPVIAEGMRLVGEDVQSVLAAPADALPYLAKVWRDAEDTI